MNINIQSATTQQATAAQITALANHILHRCGDVDFTGTDVTLQCTDTLPLGAAAIVQTCAHKQGATSFSISGASDLADSVWEQITTYGGTMWMALALIDYGIPLANIITAFGIDADICKSFDGTGRWLVGDGTAYINTGVKINNDSIVDVIFDGFNYATNQFFIGYNNSDWTNNFQMGLYAASRLIYGFPGNDYISSTGISNIHLHYEKGNTTINSTKLSTGTFETGSIFLFSENGSKSHGGSNSVSRVPHLNIKNDLDGNNHFFIPMTKDSVNGMYDLIGQQFYANANTSGAFTIE